MGNLRTYRQTLRGYQAYGIRNWETGIGRGIGRGKGSESRS